MKTELTAAEILAAHGSQLDFVPFGHDVTIKAMLEDEPAVKWTLIREDTAPNGVKCPTYYARYIGDASPALLTINDAVEPTLETEAEAERTLSDMGISMRNELTVIKITRSNGYAHVTWGESYPEGGLDDCTVVTDRLAIDDLATEEEQADDITSQMRALAAARGLDY